MAALPSSESNATGTALLAILVLALAGQLAWWTWRFVAPDRRVEAAGERDSGIDLDAVARLLGASRASVAIGPSVHLKGGIGPPPGPGAANNDFSFARKDLDTALRDPGQLGYLGQIGVAPGGGVRLDAAPPGSLAAKLGLQPGDVIRRVNGQSISSPGDLARLYQQFAT